MYLGAAAVAAWPLKLVPVAAFGAFGESPRRLRLIFYRLLSKTRAVFGPWLQMDTRKERFIGDYKFGITRWANGLLKRDYREGFVVPEEV